MNYRAEIDVMPLKELLDPQGKAVEQGLEKMRLAEVKDVRVGKHISIRLSAASKEEAHEAGSKRLVKNCSLIR